MKYEELSQLTTNYNLNMVEDGPLDTRLDSITYLLPDGTRGVLGTGPDFRGDSSVILFDKNDNDRPYLARCDYDGKLNLESHPLSAEDMEDFLHNPDNPKVERPGLFNRLISGIREAFGMAPTDAVKNYRAYRQKQAEFVKDLKLGREFSRNEALPKSAPEQQAKEEEVSTVEPFKETFAPVADDLDDDLSFDDKPVTSKDLKNRRYTAARDEFLEKIEGLCKNGDSADLEKNQAFLQQMKQEVSNPRPDAADLMHVMAALDEKGLGQLRDAVQGDQKLSVKDALDHFGKPDPQAANKVNALTKVLAKPQAGPTK